ncbi:MAG: helix-turn-helix domain-containing protein [Gammaproteobacteria bacterium]
MLQTIRFPPPCSVEQFPNYMVSAPRIVSTGRGWTGITARVYDLPANPEVVSLPAVDDFCISLRLSKTPMDVERSFGGLFKKARVTEGSISFVPAKSAVSWRSDEPLSVMHIHISHSFLQSHLSDAIQDHCVDRIECLDMLGIRDEMLWELGRGFLSEMTTPNMQDRLYVESLGHMIATHLMHRYAIDLKRQPGLPLTLSPSGIDKTIKFIDENLDQDLSLEQLANVAHLSLYYFLRQFKTICGMTPHQYVLKSRIKRAKHLLAATRYSIVEISQMTGFVSQSHFANVFKAQAGVTPRAFRRNR